jgi:murein DD-endopeptidase MepM/ murein hydrolase activator NlpD
MSEPELIRPLRHWRIRSRTLPADQNIFGTNLSRRNTGTHYGWDLEAPVGTSVYAVGAGRVIFAQSFPGYGLLVMHAFSFQGTTYYAGYAHLSAASVRNGQDVIAGQEIGRTGTSGNASSADPHLHLEFHDAPTLPRGVGGKVNPSFFFGPPPI